MNTKCRFFALVVGLTAAGGAFAAKVFDAKIVRIDANTVTLKTESGVVPNPGDAVQIGMDFPELEYFQAKALGVVRQANADLIVVEVFTTLEPIKEFDVVRITSENPTKPDQTRPGTPVKPIQARRYALVFDTLNEGPQERDALARFGIAALRAGEGKPIISTSTAAQVLPEGRTKLLSADSTSTHTSTLVLEFQVPMRQVELMRIGVVNGGSLPKWTMHGLDREGKVVDTIGEQDWGFDPQPKRFSVTGRGIVSVRIDVDNRWGDSTFATYSALPIVELLLETDLVSANGSRSSGLPPVNEPKSGARSGGLVVVAKSQNGRSDLILMRLDGQVVKNLTAAFKLSGGSFPAWRPDGTKIVFTSSDNQGGGLFIMNADGASARRLTHGNDVAATWSPDGQRIAFMRYPQGTTNVTQIVVTDVSGPRGAAVGLTDGTAYDADPAWSPNGKQIAFASNRSGGGFHLYVMDADGENVRDVSHADNPNGSVYPAWSPDGRRIAYTDRGPDGQRHLFVIDADGRNKTQIANQGQLETFAAWSPDGRKIAYVSFVGRQGKLIEINPDGSGARAISDAAVDGSRPAWKPN